METCLKVLALLWLFLFLGLAGCSSVTFVPVDEELELPAKESGFEVRLVDRNAADPWKIIGAISCQDSSSSSIWNWWTDQKALVVKMQAGNEERLLERVRAVGGEVLIGLTHDISSGGSGGGLGVGVGVGYGPVGIGLGTGLLGGGPKIIVVTYGDVGVKTLPAD
jgi:hypothetical protein